MSEDEGLKYTPIERVVPGDMEQWLAEKLAGAVCDPRLNTRGSGVRERLRLGDACATMRMAERDTAWMFKGPSAIREVLEAMRSAGLEPPAYCAHHLSTCGINHNSSFLKSSGAWWIFLWLGICVDRLDSPNVEALEHVARRILMIQRAIQRKRVAWSLSRFREACARYPRRLSRRS